MQIRREDELFAKYGPPSRPISPAPESTHPKKMTSPGNESVEIDNKPTKPQAERESSPHQQRSASPPSQFPPELIDHIVDHLHDDKKALIQCSRTSRVFSHATSYHLFRAVNILSAQFCVQFQELISSSLHPPSQSSATPPAASASSSASPSPPSSCMTHRQATGWDISKFVRKIEFYNFESPIDEYVSEAVKLVAMLPRIREVVFGWWMETGPLERIARAFAAIPAPAGNHGHPFHQPPSSAPTNAFSETRAAQTSTNDPLKVQLQLVDFESVPTFLDFLGAFGGRVRELSLVNVAIGGGGGVGKDSVEHRCLPEIESVYLGYDAVVRPKASGQDGPIMGATNLLFGTSAIDQTYDICNILERIAPNVSELQLFRDDDGSDVCMSVNSMARTLRLPRFRKLKSVIMCVPGPGWSDLIYEIAAWSARDDSREEIADRNRQSASTSPSSVISSLPSSTSATRADGWESRRKTKVRFVYPVREGDVDWVKLQSAVLGEGAEGQEGRCYCAGYGNHAGRTGRESGGGNGNDHVDGMMRINNGVGYGAGGNCHRRSSSTAGSLLVEFKGGSGVLRKVRERLGRLDELGLLQLSSR